MDQKNIDHGCKLDMSRGCEICNCGEETSTKVCEGCFKLHTTDWLEGYPVMEQGDIYEVRFKNTRRGYYLNVNNLELKRGDVVAVEASPGHDIGIISMTGDMVARQMRRVGFSPLNGEYKKIYRKAKPHDIEKWQEAIALEHTTMIRSRQIAADMGLNMKIGDVEYQGDRIKAIFYYIADERVDFRELIKVFAEQFHIRVEMKQIGARQEAGRIGGLGSCGRELCCASWISNFVSVTTNAARTQDISLNPQKLAGQCSKLKCCMIYELDTYLDARKDIPKVYNSLLTMDGEYHLVKTDILARTMSFSSVPHSMAGMVTIPVSRVNEILDLNKHGKKPDKLVSESATPPAKEDPGFVNVIGEESITRFDVPAARKNRSKKKKSPNQQSQAREAKVEGESKNPKDNNHRNRRNNNRKNGAPAGSNGSGNNRNISAAGAAANKQEQRPPGNRPRNRKPRKPQQNTEKN